MTAATPPSTPSPPTGSRPVSPEARALATGPGAPAARALRSPWLIEVTKRQWSTPAMLQRANTYLLVAVVVFGVTATFGGVLWSNAAQATSDNTAPALIGTQRLYSRVAEANAEATAAHLAIGIGRSDRLNRNAYLNALDQATIEGEQVSATIGTDELAHQAMQGINRGLVDFAGRIEAARVLNQRTAPQAIEEIREALAVIDNDLDPAVVVLNTQGRDKLDRERTAGQLVGWVAMGLGTATLGGLIWVQRELHRRTKRRLSIPLVIATLLVLATVGALALASTSRASALSSASDGGLDAIVTSSQLQRSIYDLQSDLSLQVIDGETRPIAAAIDAIDADITALANGADSNREAAAAGVLVTRWDRYASAAEAISSQAGRDQAAAADTFGDVGLAAFTGVNLAVESALSDNQAQFQDGVDRAAETVRLVPFIVVLLLVLTVVGIVIGIQQRLGDFR